MAEPSAGEAILVDANLVLWAHHGQLARHEQARARWARTLTESPLVGLPRPTILAFHRLSTHPRILERPSTREPRGAWWPPGSNVRTSERPMPSPTDRHAELLRRLLADGGASGNHVPDAHVAALAIEWGLELQSADADFARYPGLRWRNPLAGT